MSLCPLQRWICLDGDAIPIEERDPAELLRCKGVDECGETRDLNLVGADTRGYNPAFDITPAELVSALITECGIYPATGEGLRRLKLAIDN